MATYSKYRPLPEPYYALIGAIVTEWAIVEARLLRTLYVATGVDPKRGRVAVISPRADTTPAVIRNVLAARKIDISPHKPLANDLKAASESRDALAHGVWIRIPSTPVPHLQITRGDWRGDSVLAGTSRRINPEGQPLLPEDLAGILTFIKSVGDRASEYDAMVKDALSTSRKRLRAPRPQRKRRAKRRQSP